MEICSRTCEASAMSRILHIRSSRSIEYLEACTKRDIKISADDSILVRPFEFPKMDKVISFNKIESTVSAKITEDEDVAQTFNELEF